MRQQTDAERQRAFVERAKAALDQQVEALDPNRAARLRTARRTALAGLATRRPRWVWATSGLAVAATVAFALLLWLTSPTTQGPVPQLEDLELLTSSENLEFYEDLEFYDWLAQEGPTG